MGCRCSITNCSNNYGPYHFPEKLIPLMIAKALDGEPLPVYGKGDQVRDWLYVEDHVRALQAVFERGDPAEPTMSAGTTRSRTSRWSARSARSSTVCARVPTAVRTPSRSRLSPTGPGHDKRYAIDATRIRDELGWAPAETFESGHREDRALVPR